MASWSYNSSVFLKESFLISSQSSKYLSTGFEKLFSIEDLRTSRIYIELTNTESKLVLSGSVQRLGTKNKRRMKLFVYVFLLRGSKNVVSKKLLVVSFRHSFFNNWLNLQYILVQVIFIMHVLFENAAMLLFEIILTWIWTNNLSQVWYFHSWMTDHRVTTGNRTRS